MENEKNAMQATPEQVSNDISLPGYVTRYLIHQAEAAVNAANDRLRSD